LETVDLVIRNGVLAADSSSVPVDVAVKDGLVYAIGHLADFRGEDEVDATDLWVFPGFIDENVHSRDPGLTGKEDFEHSTRAAHERAEHLTPKAFVDYGLWGMILGDRNIHALAELRDAGTVGYKLFWGYSLRRDTLELAYEPGGSSDSLPPPTDGEIYEAFVRVAGVGRAVAIHAENSSVISRLVSLEREKGSIDYDAFLRTRPPYTETSTIQTGLALARAAGVHLHVLHVSAAEGLDLISEARANGQRVSAETCPHYLILSADDFESIGMEMKVFPPIREEGNRLSLVEAVKAGRVQTLGSDHAPHAPDEKARGIWDAPAGAAGIQSLVLATIDAVVRADLSRSDAVRLLCENPARLTGTFGPKGRLAAGADADLCLVDPRASTTLDQGDLMKNRTSPFVGRTFRGALVAAFLRGRQIMQDGSPIGPPSGVLVTPHTNDSVTRP
jgi:dihydroorotase-like cyclic amidohydrolase